MTSEAQSVVDAARAAGLTVGCAESLTGGLVASGIVAIPGASAVFRGGIVAYDSMLKNDLLGVDASALAREGAVTAEVASAMAEGALTRLGVDVAVAT
ncbi:MAG: CinA family protein, partial [Pontimonas sp.]